MKVLSSPINEVWQIIGEQVVENKSYRESSFCVEIKVDKGFLLYNTLTKECLYVTREEKIHEKRYLIQEWFYVPNNFDEVSFVDEVREVCRMTHQQVNGYIGYTILPTTDCNARCFYCFEAGCKKITMSNDMAKKVVGFISKTRNTKAKLLLNWFGGEPLYNYPAISVICDGLKNENISFESHMITNGFLFSKEMIEKAVSNWHLKHLQITLDGTEKTYNKVKAYIYEENAYKRVLKNIDGLLDSGVTVDVRLNIDIYNRDDIDKLVEELALRYKNKKGLHVYSHPLFEEVGSCKYKRTSERRNEVFSFQRLLREKIKSLGLCKSQFCIDNEFKYYWCKADRPNNIVILPNGYLTKCDSCIDRNYVGHIDDKILDENALAKFSKLRERIEECGTCHFYPECIRLELCHSFVKCYKEYREQKMFDVKEYILNEYNSYLERQKKGEMSEQKV